MNVFPDMLILLAQLATIPGFILSFITANRKPRTDHSFLVSFVLFLLSTCVLLLTFSISDGGPFVTAFPPLERGISSLKSQLSPNNDSPSSSSLNSSLPSVRLLCWIMTGPQFHRERADHVMATWAKRCTKFVFVTTQADEHLPTWVFNITEGRNFLWDKIRTGYQYCHDHFIDEYDFFLKADDNTYVVVENLMHLLSNYKADDPIYFGERMHYAVDRKYLKNGYPSGGPSYILSREAVKRFVQVIPDPNLCFQGKTVNEDVEIARCVENKGVRPAEVRDAGGKHRMIPIGIEDIISPTANSHLTIWYENESVYKLKKGPSNISDYIISLHYVTPPMMYVYDHLIYNMKVIGKDIPFQNAQSAYMKEQ